MFKAFLVLPQREYYLSALLVLAMGASFQYPQFWWACFFIAGLGAIPTLWDAGLALWRRQITIDTFNAFALVISFVTGELRSALFIGLMLSFARVLDWRTSSRSHHAIEELLSLKPITATIEKNGKYTAVKVSRVKRGDIVVVKTGERIPVDGKIIFGEASINESSVTGESRLVEKRRGDMVVSATMNEAGIIKIEATAVGKDSTIERIASLIREAAHNKSYSEKLADYFAKLFLPLVIVIGIITYIVTRNISMVAALFLVACADDMAVAIPLAITASVGEAARRGVIIKGGQWLDVLGKIKTVVLDKTGTLTYGHPSVMYVKIRPSVSKQLFWKMVGIAEKFSEHPAGKALYDEAKKHVKDIADPEKFKVHKGKGVVAIYEGKEIRIGNEKLAQEDLSLIHKDMKAVSSTYRQTVSVVVVDGKYCGLVVVADAIKKEAKESMALLKEKGVRVVMMTGDIPEIAADVAANLGIDDYFASMSPEGKLRALEKLRSEGPVAMIGDGINDAPALARADVGVAMGGVGTAVAVEAADVVVLTDNLSRLSEMIGLGRKTSKVIYVNMAIWLITNIVGFALVFTGYLSPAWAAFYNFATDFLPLINSLQLFKRKE